MDNISFNIEQENGFRIEGTIHSGVEASHTCEVRVYDTLEEPRISRTKMVGSSMLHVLAAATSSAVAKLSGHTLMELKEGVIPVKVCTVMMSHLSDLQHTTGSIQTMRVNNRLNFVKTLMQKYPNTDVEIDADAEWEEFTKTRFWRPEA